MGLVNLSGTYELSLKALHNCFIAQMVEQRTVNPLVARSIRAEAAIITWKTTESQKLRLALRCWLQPHFKGIKVEKTLDNSWGGELETLSSYSNT